MPKTGRGAAGSEMRPKPDARGRTRAAAAPAAPAWTGPRTSAPSPADQSTSVADRCRPRNRRRAQNGQPIRTVSPYTIAWFIAKEANASTTNLMKAERRQGG